VARTESEKIKAETLKAQKKGLKTLRSTTFLTNLAITVLLSIVFILLLLTVMQDGEVNTFDPYAILGIDTGSDSKTIKKAYRKLSLMYHPDKNPDDRVAEAKFMIVAKAYEALTDEAAKENFEKFGNPDGKQSLQVSIGLPTFLLESTNRNLVLIVYLIVMVGVIPFCVYSYYSDSSLYGEKDVMYDTYSWYHHSLSETTVVKSLPEVLAGSAEFRKRNIPTDPDDKKAIASMSTQVKSYMSKPQYNHPVCVKGNILLHVHLLRKMTLLNKQHQDDLKYMLQVSTALIDAMISVCKHQDTLATAATCIEFGQYMTQALWVKDSPLLQLPHFTTEEAKHCKTKAGTMIKSIKEYKELPDDQKKGMVNFTESQRRDVMKFLNIYPDITVTTKVFVDDDEDDTIYEGDLCTVQVTIVRNNLNDNEKTGLVHAPYFPFPKQEAFWVILGQVTQGKIISIDKVGNPNKKVVHNIKFLAPAVGHYEFDLLVKSNAYFGMDETIKIQMETLDNSTLPEYKIHPDDAVLDDEPTLFEEMLNAHIEQDSDDEDDDDEDDDDDEKDGDRKEKVSSTTTTAAATETDTEKRKKALRLARQQEDDEDDDDDIVEVHAEK
jgi:translocation protein SEC63